MNDKKTSYKGIIIFLIIFAILAVALTVFYARNVKIGKVESIGELIDIAFKGEPDEIDYEALFEADKKYVSNWDESYFTNNIELIEKEYVSGEVVNISEYNGEEIYEKEATYYQIDGLKDEELENKINDRLKQEVFKLLEEESDKFGRTYVITSIKGNFSNILSIYVSLWRYTAGGDTKSSDKYINIDLSTGNDIKFEDLFVKGTSIKNLIYNTLYENVKNYHSFHGDSYFMGLKREDYYLMENNENESDLYIRSQFEDIVFKHFNKFDLDSLKFLVSPDSIYVYFPGLLDLNEGLYIDLRENLESIALHKRFLKDQSIFTEEYNNFFSSTCGFKCDRYEKNEFLLDNLFVAYHFTSESEGSEIQKIANEKIAVEKKYASLNNDKVVFLGLDIDKDRYDCIMVEIAKKDYENNKEEILKTLNSNWLGVEDAILGFSKLDESEINYISSYDYDYIVENEEGKKYWAEEVYRIDTYSRVINSQELKELSLEKLDLMYNEIFARHGHDFTTEKYREYFGARIWYKPIYKKQVSLDELSDIERANLQIIKDEIARAKK